METSEEVERRGIAEKSETFRFRHATVVSAGGRWKEEWLSTSKGRGRSGTLGKRRRQKSAPRLLYRKRMQDPTQHCTYSKAIVRLVLSTGLGSR